MIEHYRIGVEAFLAAYGVLAVFALGILEEILFFIPFSLLFVVAGFLLIDPAWSFWLAMAASLVRVALPATIGVTLGGLAVYGFFFWGGKKIIKRYGSHIGLIWEDLESLYSYFSKHRVDEMVLLALRAIPILPIGLVSIVCGIVRIDRGEFLWTTFVGTLIRLTALGLAGWYLGREYVKYADYIAVWERYIIFGFLIILLLALVFAYVKQSTRRTN